MIGGGRFYEGYVSMRHRLLQGPAQEQDTELHNIPNYLGWRRLIECCAGKSRQKYCSGMQWAKTYGVREQSQNK